ncbi:MAG: sugar phosphate isomerase/epimerase [Clostridia bacterium]|nr:sugar phosphate isomerase/epimerase [Clostridia bacterium]
MQTGVSTASLFMRKYNEEALPLLNDLGVRTAEVFLTSFSEYGKAFGAVLSNVQGDLTVNSVHALNTEFEPQLFSAHPRVRDDAYGWLDKVLESANCLRAPYYTFHGTSRVKKASRSGKYDDFPSIIKGFDELTAHCKERGVTLCLENVEWSTYNRVGVFSKIAAAVPDLYGVLDIKQARISEYPYVEYLREMGERLAYVHISDVDERGKIRLPGQGIFDFDTLIKRLKDVGFDGALLIEVYKNDYADVAELKTACDFVDEILYKNNALR